MVADALKVLFAGFYVAPMADDSRRAQMTAYAIGLDGLPGWAIGKAVRAVLKGHAGDDNRFVPKPPELRRIAEAEVTRAEYELRGLEILLEATERPAEIQARAGMRDRIAALLGPAWAKESG